MSDPNWPPPAPPPYVPAPPRAPDDSRLASVGARGAALVLDYLIVLALFVVAVVIAGGIDGAAGAIIAVVAYLALLVYAPLTMMRPGAHNGQTFGKQALGIRVRREEGETMGFWWAFLREIVTKGVLGVLVVPIVLSYLWPLWDERRQALHDKMASTLVVEA